MREIQKGERGTRGIWHPSDLVTTQSSRRIAILHCPICGDPGSLAGHAIAADGTVTPSVKCPTRCGFHGDVRLLGWEPLQPVS